MINSRITTNASREKGERGKGKGKREKVKGKRERGKGKGKGKFKKKNLGRVAESSLATGEKNKVSGKSSRSYLSSQPSLSSLLCILQLPYGRVGTNADCCTRPSQDNSARHKFLSTTTTLITGVTTAFYRGSTSTGITGCRRYGIRASPQFLSKNAWVSEEFFEGVKCWLLRC